jgi:hypothetical protein
VRWNVALNYDGSYMRPKGFRLVISFHGGNGAFHGEWDAYFDNTSKISESEPYTRLHSSYESLYFDLMRSIANRYVPIGYDEEFIQMPDFPKNNSTR